MNQTIFEVCQQRATIFTPTRRLATYLTECWVTESTKTTAVVEKPYIFSFEDACLEMFRQLQAHGKISELYISAAESLLILEDIIQHSEQGAGLLKITSTAKLVWQAWQNFTLWNCKIDAIDWQQEDLQAFRIWIKQYLAKLKKAGWIDKPRLLDVIQPNINHSSQFLNIAPKRNIMLYGFDDIPPRHQDFLAHLKQNNWHVTDFKLADAHTVPRRYTFQTVESEFKATAEWANELLAQDVDARIGIVIPELPRYRLMVEKIFRDTFHAESILYPEPLVSEYYNMSAGQPLNTIPIIHDALEHLSVMKVKDVQSTYLHWVTIINQSLASMDWPGERRLNSVEHQAVKQWVGLLENFARLDNLFEPTTYKLAYLKLRHLAQDMPFQPQSNIVKLHILGALEAAGQSFTHLWITGLNDTDWPSLANPNPFLPQAMQRTLNMPHASHERQWAFSEKMTNRLLSSANNVTVSYAKNHQKQSYSVSALISQYLEDEYRTVSQCKTVSLVQRLFDSRNFETISDKVGPVLEHNAIPSSSKTLKLQANCPFRAFAEMRLKLVDPIKVELGLNLRDRGILTHQILDSLWGQLKTQRNLLALTNEALDNLIKDTVQQQIRGFNPQHLGKHFWETETIRLQKLMLAWLTLEMKRADFEVVAREAYYPVQIADMSLKICIDRVDKNESEQYFVIDYKTGAVNLSGLLGDKLLEPQLPLYCFNGQFPTPSGIVFAQVRSDGCRFVGLSHLPAYPDVKTMSEDEWERAIDFWEHSLEKLISDFKSGEASVLPIEKQKTCRHCHLPSLCRIKGEGYAG